MQSQPFTLEHLCEDRRIDLHAAALDVRGERYSRQVSVRRRLTAWLAALASRRPQFQPRSSTAGTSVRPVVR